MTQGRARKILDMVCDIVSHWRDYSEEAGVERHHHDRIYKTLLLEKMDLSGAER